MFVEITIPAYNEEEILEKSSSRLFSFLKNVNFKYTVTIADNGSKDRTLEIANKLAKKYKNLKVFHTDKPGKGNAIKCAWKESKAELLCFMDADLSTELTHLNEMVALLKENDLVIGNRLSRSSKTKRSIYRTIVSIIYNRIAKICLGIKANDLQCGFKGIKKQVFLELAGKLEEEGLFFDTELIAWAEKKGYKIKELPVKWTERKASKIRIYSTAGNYLRQLLLLKKRLKNAI